MRRLPDQYSTLASASVLRLASQSEARASAFRAMHDWLDASRRADEAAMAELRSSVDRARRMQASRAVRERRTWAFPLYPDGVLDTLRGFLGTP